MADELTLAPLVAFQAMLDAAGIRNAQDSADLTPPGVLVKVQSFDRPALGGDMVCTARVFVVVPAGANHDAALKALVADCNELLELVDPDGPVEATAVALASSPGTALPSLAFPLHLY